MAESKNTKNDSLGKPCSPVHDDAETSNYNDADFSAEETTEESK